MDETYSGFQALPKLGSEKCMAIYRLKAPADGVQLGQIVIDNTGDNTSQAMYNYLANMHVEDNINIRLLNNED